MLDEFLIRHSAPTLAGLKTANLFWYPWKERREMETSMRQWREILQEKGLELRILKNNGQRSLLYLYRRKNLEQDLSRSKTVQMLHAEGYEYHNATEALKILGKRIRKGETFPHEIGLFLGYPEEDVKGFIEHQGKNCKCCGCWKVYCDECDAKKTFCRYRKCEAVYQRLYLQGKSVRQLIVAA